MTKYEESEKRFQEKFRKELRLAGEELIRRSENMDLDGFDLMTGCKINISLPVGPGDKITFPDIHFVITCCNKVWLDNIMEDNSP